MNTKADNYDFNLVGTEDRPFLGYVSAEDPTRMSPQFMVRGSQNVLLENSGDIVNREGIKRYDPADNADNPVVSSFDWNDADGDLLLTRVLRDGEFQFYRQSNQTWYTIGEYPDNTNFSYAKWWDLENSRELLIMCNSTSDLYAWSGASTEEVGAVLVNQSLLLSGGTVVAAVALTVSNTDKLLFSNNIEPNDITSYLGLVLTDNITVAEGAFISMNITADSPFVSSGNFGIFFVDTFPAPNASITYIKIGANSVETIANLHSYFSNPASDSANVQVATNVDISDAIDYLSSKSIVNSLENGNGESFAEQGFLSPGVINVDGVAYPYNVVVENYLVGVTGTPTEGTYGFQDIVVTTNTPDEDFTNDFLLCLNNQLIACSYTSRIVHISFNEDYTVFTQTGDLIFGDPDFAILDEFPKGGTTRGDAAYIGAGQSSWYEIAPNTTIAYTASQARTVYTKVTKFSGAGLTAPLGFNFVGNLLEDIVYVDQQNQLRTLGIYRNIVQQKSPSLSLLVRKELQEEDFTGGCLRSVGEYTYLVAPRSGKTYLYEIRDDVDDMGNISSDRHWQPPQVWNISRIAIVNGIPHGYSNTNPQLYQLFETGIWHDETSVEGVQAPYISRARFAYRSYRDELIKFDKIYYEGYILPQSDLQATTYYDYQGSTYIENKVISSHTIAPIEYTNDETDLIGDSLIGDETIGGGSLDPNYPITIPKFRVINNVQINDCFEYQLELFSEALDSQWVLVALGGNEKKSVNEPIQLINVVS